MRVVCAWCQHESRPALLREVEPLDDTTETHGICAEHHLELMRQLLAAAPGELAVGPPHAPPAGAEPAALPRLRAWVLATPSVVPTALAQVVEEIDRLQARCRGLLAEGEHLGREIEWLRPEVARLQSEHDELSVWRREAARAATTLLDDVLEHALQPLHDVVARLRAAPRPVHHRRAGAASVDRHEDSL